MLQSLGEDGPKKQGVASYNDDRLLALCRGSSKAAADLLQQLGKYEVVPNRSLPGLKKAIRLEWTKKDLDVLSTRVESYRAELCTHILIDLRSKLAKILLEGDILTKDKFENSTTELTSVVNTLSKNLQEHLDSLANSRSVVASKISRLHQAVEQDDMDSIQMLLPRGAPSELVNGADKYGRTSLHFAAETGNLSVVKFLYHRHADVNVRDGAGQSPLHLSIMNDHLHVAKYLLHNCQAAKSNLDHSGRPAGDYAEHPSVTEWMLRDTVNSDGQDAGSGETALTYAVSQNDAESTRYLLSRKVNLDTKNKQGRTALMVACLRGNTEIIGMLLDGGVDPNASDEKSWNAAMHCIWGKPACSHEALRRLCKTSGQTWR